MRTGQSPGAPWLVADVGGTNVRFALAQPYAAQVLLLDSVRAYRVAAHASLADAMRAYLDTVGERPAHAVLALAGPVREQEVQLTNHSWFISAPQLQREFGLGSVRLVNDFGAIGMSLPLLARQDLAPIGPAAGAAMGPMRRRPEAQSFCVLGPGTGLGVSALLVRDGQFVGLETEGGHVGFAPGSEEEIAVLRDLMPRFGRVSVERLLCGSGLGNLHRALCAIAGIDAPALSPEQITARARAAEDPHCTRAVELFCAILGSVAGDFVLAYGAWDGVYLAGGLLAPLRPWLERGSFRGRFDAKGRFAPAMSGVPVALITHPQPGLLGAAAFAVVAAGGSLFRDGQSH